VSILATPRAHRARLALFHPLLCHPLLCLPLVAASLLLATGCTATFVPKPVAVETYTEPVLVRAELVPTDIYGYPRTYYGGTYVYLVDGRWYRPTDRGWMVYRREPTELGRERHYIYSQPTELSRERRRVYEEPTPYRRPVPAYPTEIRRERRPSP